MAGMNKYQAYPEYICISTPGLVQLPSQWEIKQIKYLLKNGSEGTKIGPFGSALKLEDMVDDGVQVYGQENVIKRNFALGKRRISFNKFNEMRVYEVFYDDILITMMGTSGKCEIVPRDAEKRIIDSHLIRVRLNKESITPAFFKLLVDESPEIKHQITIQGKGSIMLGLNSGIIRGLYLPLPNITEQKVILLFLDYENAKINNLIEKQQQLIELLKEKRRAVISHAVTKGLNPNVPMKDSGVEWFGDVPDKWKIASIKYVSKIINGSTPKSDVDKYWNGHISWFTPSDISQKENIYIKSSIRQITIDGLNSCGTSLVPEHSLILSTRAPIGSLAITASEACTNQGCKALVTTNENLSLFLYYQLSSLTEQLNNIGRGSTFLELYP